MSKLTHLDEAGHAHMVDVSEKSDTDRMACATATVQLTKAAMAVLLEGNLKKGDSIEVSMQLSSEDGKALNTIKEKINIK